MRHHYGWVVHCKTTSMTPLSASSHRSTGQHPWCYQEGSALKYKSIIQKGPTPEDIIPILVSATKKHRVQYRRDFLVFLPLYSQITKGATHTYEDIPWRAIHVTQTNVLSQSQQQFSTPPFAKHLFLAIPGCYPRAVYPSDTEIRGQHLLLLQQVCKPLPQNKPVFSYKLVFYQEDFTNSCLIPNNEIAQNTGKRKLLTEFIPHSIVPN